MSQPKVRLVIAVWGQRYIDRFASLTIPSLLAPGNLPALATRTDLEIVILTLTRDIDALERHASFLQLKLLATTRYLDIDDLVADSYTGLSLTLAYLRGITDAGTSMVDKHFLFINSDLVLADGSLEGVARRVLEGAHVILANSIRATSEALEPHLMSLIDSHNHVLAVAPRRLVGMALNSMHSTQIAKIVNSDLCHSIHVNQFYWQVDADTLISRHFLMFMLCVKPTRVIEHIDSFCDYAFVPELCPGIVPVAMEDSDDFFALELQARDSERDYLRIGRAPIAEIAAGLSRWTTRDHRENALRHTLTFHAADVPADIAASIAAADGYIRQVSSGLSPEPQPVRHHPYWVGSLRLYEDRLRILGKLDPGKRVLGAGPELAGDA